MGDVYEYNVRKEILERNKSGISLLPSQDVTGRGEAVKEYNEEHITIMMKKIICALAAVIVTVPGIAETKEVKAKTLKQEDMPSLQFSPYFFAQLQAGAGYVFPEEGSFIKLVTPMTSINAGYFFTPTWGARLSFNYGRGKSSVPQEPHVYTSGAVYGYRMLGIFADGLLNINNGLAGYKPRVVDVSLYLGGGLITGTDNYNAGYGSISLHLDLPDRWAVGQVFPAARGGLVLGVKISPEIQLLFDGGVTVSDDRLDSRIDNRPWMQGVGKVGFSYNFNPFVHEREVIVRKEANKFSFVLLNVNFVDLGNLLTLNLGADVGLSKHVALGVVGKVNPWVFNKETDNAKFDNKTMGYLTAKYYPWNIFSGLHFDVMGGASGYTQRGQEGTVDRGYKVGGGIGAGYTYVISKHLNLEIAAGAWIGNKNYDTLPALNDGKVLSSSSKFFVEPYELKIGLSWVLNPDSRPGLKYKKNKKAQTENETIE